MSGWGGVQTHCISNGENLINMDLEEYLDYLQNLKIRGDNLIEGISVRNTNLTSLSRSTLDNISGIGLSTQSSTINVNVVESNFLNNQVIHFFPYKLVLL